ncbi:MT-A70-domain-containing protein [Exidia glandulosa HHB12029]|uniref:mRNA m(6)A methyltransferase n=1 Tax=Exidia glandulosa HHB12029 TaxID=1314781 RepID=A0A165QJ25_EXIGL|nr:MT-A70-domain-containing protein [Exidia glandulosa HHB12029]
MSSFEDGVSSALKSFLVSGHAQLPIKAFDLLRALIQHVPSARLRLTDQRKLESALQRFADDWEYGHLHVTREGGTVTLLDASVLAGSASRKRKRDEEENDADVLVPVPSAVPSLKNGNGLREVYSLLQYGSAKRRLVAEQFASIDPSFEPICPHITKEECAAARHAEDPTSAPGYCDNVHFRPLIRAHTDPSLGHCSYLNTCYSEPTYALSPSIPTIPNNKTLPSGLGAGGRGKEKAPCRYLHFEVDYDPLVDGPAPRRPAKPSPHRLALGLGPAGGAQREEPVPPQWINCDMRRFDYGVLGKFHCIMADPPWDIHMSLPYGTMTDDEMRAMPIASLQDEGLLFLWVTGRAMEVGRECLRVWGYTRVDEVIWLKTNQLQRVIRTGRTGHWLNHTKEHMLVAVKTHHDANGNLKWPSWVNRGVDTDVIVSEVRETSRKPDEVYGLIERMCPGGRKLEIFGRKHNARPGWLTLGNQLGQDQIHEPDMAARVVARYPDRAAALEHVASSQ